MSTEMLTALTVESWTAAAETEKQVLAQAYQALPKKGRKALGLPAPVARALARYGVKIAPRGTSAAAIVGKVVTKKERPMLYLDYTRDALKVKLAGLKADQVRALYENLTEVVMPSVREAMQNHLSAEEAVLAERRRELDAEAIKLAELKKTLL